MEDGIVKTACLHALPQIARHTVQLLFVNDVDQPVPRGTGVLFRLAETRFLITAHHVLEELHWLDSKSPPAIGVVRDDVAELVPLNWEQRHSMGAQYDVGVIELRPDTAGQLTELGCSFVGQSELSHASDAQKPALLVVAGYPLEWSKLNEGQRPTLLAYGTGPRKHSKGEIANDGATHELQLDFSRDSIVQVTGHDVPQLRGVSGGGVWRVEIDEPWVVGKTGRATLAAIQRSLTENGVLRATRIEYPIKLVLAKHPALGPAASLTTIRTH